MMKMSGILALGTLLLPAAVKADLQVIMEMEHRKLMKYEPITVFVTIQNESESYFVAKGEKENPLARLTFIIEERKDESVARRDTAAILRGVTIRPGEQQKVPPVELSRWYALGEVGEFRLTAVVDWKRVRYSSGTVVFKVENGIPMATVSRGVEGETDATHVFSLRYLAREGSERLFLCVDDEKNAYNYGTYDLGPLIRVYKPELDVDHAGNITVLHQKGKDCYAKSLFKSTKEGVTFVDQTYHLADGSPYPKSSRVGAQTPAR